MPDKWFNAICWSSLLLGIFMIKQCVVFNLIFFGTLKYFYDKKIIEILSFLALKNNSVNTGLNFLLTLISAIVSSNTINTFLFFGGLSSSKFS